MKITKIEENEKGNKHYYLEFIENLIINVSNKIKAKRKGYKRPFKEIFSGYKPSGDLSKYPKGIDEIMIIDRENNWYNQIIKDNLSGKIIHKEHELLSYHNNKKNE
jgi:hypothetical protein